nr:potassium voltage-gated channel protein Shab-like isoform X1 [Lepeophtheirus salmonis]
MDEKCLFPPDTLVCFNVGGQKHQVLAKNFSPFPNSRLSKLIRSKTTEEIKSFCDRYVESDESGLPQFFFDRNWGGFGAILDVYRIGTLHIDVNVCALLTHKDLIYWGIDELMLEPCCALKYYPEIEVGLKEVELEDSKMKEEEEREKLENFGYSQIAKVRKYLWNLTEYPERSKGAQIFAYLSLTMIIISTSCFILSPSSSNPSSTFPEFQVGPINSTDEDVSITSSEKHDAESPILIIEIFDSITAMYFTFEFAVRLICSPTKIAFLKDPMNIIDLLAIIPYFISFILTNLEDYRIIARAGKIIRLTRVLRILRIFKLVRHFAGLQSLFYTVKQAYKELGLLLVMIGVSVLTFSFLVYFAEKDVQTGSWTFLESFWWGLMTLTTVGYGTSSPSTPAGKIIGGVCALFGMFTLTLPIPIVVNSFASFYKNRMWRNEVAIKRRQKTKEMKMNNSKQSEVTFTFSDTGKNIFTICYGTC